MKKLVCFMLTLFVIASFTACVSDSKNEKLTDEHGHDISDGHTHAENEVLTDEHGHDISDGHTHVNVETPEVIIADLKETFSEDEDTQYHDLFYNKNTAEYENKEFTKYGTFGKIYDAYNDCTRYYVWGYGDKTKECCYQWEFVMPSNASIPADGSYIKVIGTMSASEDALDGYWLTDVSVFVEKDFEETDYDYDFVTLSPTLTRVQIQNMLYKKDNFKNVSIRIPAYILSENTLCSVFEADTSWSVHYTTNNTEVNANDYVIIDGIYNADDNSTITINSVEKIK